MTAMVAAGVAAGLAETMGTDRREAVTEDEGEEVAAVATVETAAADMAVTA